MSVAKLSRKQIINALNTDAGYEFISNATEFGKETVAEFIAKWAAKANEVKPSKPSAETLKNRALMHDLVSELNARNIETTSAEFANMVVDNDGYPMSSRKVGSLLANAAKQGLIAKSPEKWDVAHYAPLGFEFAKKPKTVRAKKLADGTLVEA